MFKYILFLLSLFFIISCNWKIPSEIPVNPNSEKTIVALGDSLTAWYGLPLVDAYPSQLEARLREKWYAYRLVNAWVSGDTTAGLLSRLDWVLEWDTPSLVILCVGANDAFQWKDTVEIEKNLRQIIEKIQAKNIPILFAGMRAPLNLGGEYGKRYEAIFSKLAKEYNLIFMDFFLKDVALKWNLNQDDRIHPNRQWYAIVVENLMRILEEESVVKR